MNDGENERGTECSPVVLLLQLGQESLVLLLHLLLIPLQALQPVLKLTDLPLYRKEIQKERDREIVIDGGGLERESRERGGKREESKMRDTQKE